MYLQVISTFEKFAKNVVKHVVSGKSQPFEKDQITLEFMQSEPLEYFRDKYKQLSKIILYSWPL